MFWHRHVRPFTLDGSQVDYRVRLDRVRRICPNSEDALMTRTITTTSWLWFPNCGIRKLLLMNWLRPSVGFRVDVWVDHNVNSSANLNVLVVVEEVHLKELASRASAQTAARHMLSSSALILRWHATLASVGRVRRRGIRPATVPTRSRDR